VSSGFRVEAAGQSTHLPSDFARLLETYGAGAFNEFVAIFSVDNANRLYDIVAQTRDFAELMYEIYEDLHDDWLPYRFWPESAGLLQWGERGIETFFWLTDGHPDQWPVLIVRDTEQIYERLDLTATELLLGLVRGPSPSSFMSPLFGPDFYFSRSPTRVGGRCEAETTDV